VRIGRKGWRVAAFVVGVAKRVLPPAPLTWHACGAFGLTSALAESQASVTVGPRKWRALDATGDVETALPAMTGRVPMAAQGYWATKVVVLSLTWTV
jgi:hypothetical protein